MKTFSKALLATTISAACLFGGVQQAHAYSYAYAYDDITDFTVDVTGGVTFEAANYLVRTNAAFNANIDANNAAGQLAELPVTQYTLCDAGGCAGGVGSPGFIEGDPLGSREGKTGAGYGRGIASIETASHAHNLAEAYVTEEMTLQTANGQGTNSLAQSFSVEEADSTLRFTFMAMPYMEVAIDELDDEADEFAKSALSFSISIFDEDDNAVFGFSPEELNREFQVSVFEPMERFYNDELATYDFDVTTDPLAVGRYSLAVTMSEIADVSDTPDVPEPATMALLGLGLAGLGWKRRNKKA